MLSKPPKYRVLPKTPAVVHLSEQEKKSIEGLHGGLGCLLFVVGWAIMYSVIIHPFFRDDFRTGQALAPVLLGVLMVVGAAIVPIILHKRMKAAKILKTEQERNDRAVREEKQRVASLTNMLNETLRLSLDIAGQLPELLTNTSHLLAQARQEHTDNAFAPFWDIVEDAAISLGRYYENVQRLSHNAQFYYSSLEREKHTFPPFPIQPNELPDPTPIVEELRQVVRLGQTKFEFANIWEHRQTRKVLIAGFNTLKDAIYGLQQTIQRSMSEFKNALSSNTAKLVEEQAKTRKTLAEEGKKTRKALDNQSEDLEGMISDALDKTLRHRRRPRKR